MIAGGKRYIVYPSRSDAFRIWYVSDLHLMNRSCAEDRLKADLAVIKDDPYSFWVGGGDYCDFIGYSDKRFDPDSVAPWVKVSDLADLGRVGMQRVAKLFDPIRDKCLGLLLGNHELKYSLCTQHESLHGWLCTELGVPNLGYCALFDVVFRRMAGSKTPKLQGRPCSNKTGASSTTVRIFCHHGAGYAQTPGGKLNRLIQFMDSFEADIFFVGHVHDQVGKKHPVLGADAACRTITEQVKLGLIAGSYLKTYAQPTTPDGRPWPSYGEQRGYRPTLLGAAEASFKPMTGELKGVI